MEIQRIQLRRQTVDGFAKEHTLIMEVHERYADASPTRFYAHFKSAEILEGGLEGGLLRSAFGNGANEEAAIEAYAAEISGQILVIDAGRPTRREISVPILGVARDVGDNGWWTEEAMIRHGGSFVQALGRAARHADGDNLRRIKQAFPGYWARYERLGSDPAFRAEVEAR